jgi:hypothetical protein
MAVHIYTQTIYRITQITNNVEECGPCHVFVNLTLAFALQLRKKHGKTSVTVRKTPVRVHITKTPTHYKNTYTNKHTNTRTHAHTQTHTHYKKI